MWHLDHELEPWFEDVQQKRKERYGGNDDRDDRTEVPMMGNELAGELKKR